MRQTIPDQALSRVPIQPLNPPPAAEREAAMRRLAASVDKMNEAVRAAVATGLSVEVVRTCRHHDGRGNWGDQMEARRTLRRTKR